MSVPAVSARVVSTVQLLPNVAEKPELFMVNVVILSVVPGVVGSKNSVPRLVVELIDKFEVALPVRYFVADMPATVPFRVNVNEPMVNELFAPVKVSTPFTVGLPVKLNALAEPQFSSRLPNLAADIVLAMPVILILPLPVLV